MGHRKILIEQSSAQLKAGIAPGRAGRRRRDVTTVLQACCVTLMALTQDLPALRAHVVRVTPQANSPANQPDNGFEWVLLTTETIETYADIVCIVRDYEFRWLIEEFHKCCGTPL